MGCSKGKHRVQEEISLKLMEAETSFGISLFKPGSILL